MTPTDFKWLLLIVNLNTHVKIEAVSSDCFAAKFSTIPDHTACLTTSQYAEEPRGVKNDDIKKILNRHNELRASIIEARNMQKMVWDEELSKIAQKWADNCYYEHENPSSRRKIPGRFSVGQNLAIGYGEWLHVVQAWFDEQANFTYGNKASNVFEDVGHYTQLVWADSSKLGCGFTNCANVGKFYVCNYGPLGNIGDWSKPYQRRAGAQCSSCTSKCVTAGAYEGLCDCNGKACSNGGKLDLNTCTCTCVEPEPLHLPDKDCAVNCTDTDDNFSCGTFFKDCKLNTADYCPHMCDVCPFGAFDYREGTVDDTTPSRSDAGQLVVHSVAFSYLLSILYLLINSLI